MTRPNHDNWKPADVARLLALVETERRYYQELFAALPVPAALLDGELALVAANREFRRRFGLESPDLSQFRLADLLPSEELDAAAQQVVEGREARVESHIELGLREPRAYRITLQATVGWQDAGDREMLLTVEEVEPAGARREWAPPAPLVAWLLDGETGAFTRVSPGSEERLGVPEAAWVSVEAWAEARVHPEDRGSYLEFYREILPEAGQGTLEYRMFDGAGQVRAMREHAGKLSGGWFEGVTLDLTAARRRERREREAAKRGGLERLSGRLAHVANNLLMIIGGYAEELRESLPADDGRREDLDEILRASARLAGLTTQLTGLARPAPVKAEPFPWSAWAAGLNGEAEPQGADWTLHGPGPLMAQFVTEIRRGCGWSEAQAPPLRVVETGAGEVEIRMDLEGVDRARAVELLEPFSGPREGSDPPLGAAALVAPLEAAGVEVDVDEERMLLCLRLKAERAARTAPAPRATVLLVEDEDGIRSLIEKTLVRAGYEVLSAPWAEQALALCRDRERPVDLLISDIMMPGAGGREVAVRLREVWPALQVLFISGHHDDPLLEQELTAGRAAGTSLMLRKPFTLADLQSAVEALLGRRSAAAGGVG